MRRLLIAVLAISAACGGGSKKKPDAGTDGGGDGGTVETVCRSLPATQTTCAVTAGSSTLLLEGNVVTPGMVFKGGQVLVDTTGKISCVGCDCGTGGETVIACADATISPGLINTHDHITYTQDNPYNNTGERYEDRQQWREGLDGHTKVPAPGSATSDQVSWGEMRFLMGGATSIVGSGGAAGLLRNLDKATLLEGLTDKAVKFDTFPLGDSSGTRRTGDCNYGSTATTAASLASVDSYEPHTSEGIDSTAHNEFLCESSATYDTAAPGVSNDLVISKTAMIHAIGLTVDDYALMAASSTGLIWSPRSNITLYGDTARVTEADRLGVRIALGTDWMPSGSMNMLRELRCADQFNQTYLGKYFSDEKLWEMVTSSAASITATDDSIGTLAMGKVADISIFAAHGKDSYRAVLEADPQDVALVMRGGKVLYGDDAVVGGLAQGCDTLDVCGTSKQVCLMGEIGKNLAALQTSVGTIYPAFACGQPMNEPSCTPTRPASVAGSTVYTGVPGAGDMDGDGVPDASDNCPSVFNPVRPMDNGMQGDGDADGVGDACDPCPRDANQTSCTAFDPNDKDGDGFPNATDNCPDIANPSQTDSDSDGKGDACDACPNTANMGAAGCPATIYQIKQGQGVTQHEDVEVTNALVTGKGTNGFFVQTKMGDTGYMGSDYSGLFVFAGTGSPLLANAVVGTRVTIDGAVDTFQGEIELDSLSAVTQTTMTPEALPAAIPATYAEVATGGTRAATLESVLVALGSSQTTAVTGLEFTVTDANNANLIVSNLLFQHPNPAVGETFTALTGILATRGSVSRLEPRSAADLVSGPPVLANMTGTNTTSFVRVGAASGPAFPTAITVNLTGPAQGATFVSVMSNDPAVVVTGGGVTIADTQTSGVVQLTATAPVADVTLTAMYQTGTATAHVRALGATEAPTTVSLPATLTVAAGTTKPVTVTLDIPAPTGGTVVSLVASAGTIAANVTIPQDAISANVNYTAPMTGTTATITATLASSMSTTNVTIGTDHLVINELDYDNVGTGDPAEFIEIYNPSAADADLTGITIYLVNGNGNATYATIDLSSVGSLASHDYLVISGTNVTAANGNSYDPGWGSGGDKIQNGPPDGIALVDTSTNTIIDALSYEGAMTMAVLPNFPSPVSLVEGTVLATATADSNTTDGSLCRQPNGTDTDNANADWHFCATKSPGAANP